MVTKIELDSEKARKFELLCLLETELKTLNVKDFKVKKIQIIGKRMVVHIINLTESLK